MTDKEQIEEIRTIRVTFTDETIYSCHISNYFTCQYENVSYLYIEEWYADGHRREVNIALDKIKMFMIEWCCNE